MGYKQKGLGDYLQRFGVVKVLGVLFLVSAVAIGIVLANDPDAVTFNSGASSKPLSFDQAAKLGSDGQGFKVDSEKDIANLQSFTVEGWVKLDAALPLNHPEVIFKIGNSQGESGPGLGSFVVYVDRPNAFNYGGNYSKIMGTLVVGLNTQPNSTHPEGEFKIFDVDPITTERTPDGNLVIGSGLFDKQWHHLAVSVSSNSVNQRRNGVPVVVGVYIDGKNTVPNVINAGRVVGSFTTEAINYGASPNSLFVGADVFGSSNRVFQGQIDEVRFSKTARYTKDFTPRNQPFKDDASAITILHLDGSIVPAKGTRGTVTVFGTSAFDASFQ